VLGSPPHNGVVADSKAQTVKAEIGASIKCESKIGEDGPLTAEQLLREMDMVKLHQERISRMFAQLQGKKRKLEESNGHRTSASPSASKRKRSDESTNQAARHVESANTTSILQEGTTKEGANEGEIEIESEDEDEEEGDEDDEDEQE